MQPIIVATDFSDAARNALRFAARLAIARNCPIRVVHAYTWPIGSGDPILLPATLESIERNIDESLTALSGTLLEEFPDVQAQFEKLPAGNIAFEIARYCAEQRAFLLVLGTHGRAGIENWFSEGLRLLHKCAVPLLMVPAGFTGTGWMRAVLAFDGSPLKPAQQQRIGTVMSELHALLDVVHVQSSKSGRPEFPDLGQQSGSNHTVLAETVTSGLRSYLAQNPTDLVVVLPHHHSLWERLVSRAHTPSLVSEMPLPVLVMPEC